MALAGRCGQQLAAVLLGQADPLEVLLPDRSFSMLEALYQDSPLARYYNTLVAEAVCAASAKLPVDRELRILEIGAGTGGTTAHLLPRLPADRTEFVFTDVSAVFTALATDKFRQYPFVQYSLLDIERDPLSQSFEPHHFDVILAANVLHSTADLRGVLANVKTLLASHGLLMLLEGTRPQRLLDLIFGLTEGWWKFADTGPAADPSTDFPPAVERFAGRNGFRRSSRTSARDQRPCR